MKNKKIIITIISIIVCLFIIGSSLAYFQNTFITQNNINSEEYNITYNYSYQAPDNWIPGTSEEISMTVKNESTIPIAIRASITEEWTSKNNNKLSNTLTNGEDTVLKQINNNWYKKGLYYYYNKQLLPNEETTSIIDYITYNSNTEIDLDCTTESNKTTCTNNDSYSGANYILNISFETIQYDIYEEAWNINSEEKSLYSEITKSKIYDDTKSLYVTNIYGINLNNKSSDLNGKGIYIKKDTVKTDYPIYYYRGNVNNNNVVLNNICFKIVRTTNTGGIKLIYNGLYKNNSCNNEGENTTIGLSSYNNKANSDNTNIGYMFGIKNATSYESAHQNTNESNIKELIDNWYQQNLLDKTSLLEDTIYCNDRRIDKTLGNNLITLPDSTTIYTILGYAKNPTIYQGTSRLGNNTINKNINLSCETNDSFTVSTTFGNGNLKYPTGTITLDELTMAGAISQTSLENEPATNTDFYLYSGISYWTMTPAHVSGTTPDVYISRLSNKGFTQTALANDNQTYVRPMITLNNNVTYKNGDGTINNPYIINTLSNS